MNDANDQNLGAENAKDNTVGIDQNMPINKFGVKFFTNFRETFRVVPQRFQSFSKTTFELVCRFWMISRNIV